MILGDDGPTVLEVNAIPGLTDTSLLPQAADAAGLSFDDVVARVLDEALNRQGRRMCRPRDRCMRRSPRVHAPVRSIIVSSRRRSPRA